jgi:hypothetical protein
VEDLKQGLLVYSEGQVMMILEHYLVRVVLLVLMARQLFLGKQCRF